LENGNLENAKEIAYPLNKIFLLVVQNFNVDHSKINYYGDIFRQYYGDENKTKIVSLITYIKPPPSPASPKENNQDMIKFPAGF
jgi:hypothetical protein